MWATDINGAALAALAAECPGLKTRMLNVRDASAVSTIAADLGAVDVLFNCAGYVHQGDILACSEEDWAFSVDLNVTGCIGCAGRFCRR